MSAGLRGLVSANVTREAVADLLSQVKRDEVAALEREWRAIRYDDPPPPPPPASPPPPPKPLRPTPPHVPKPPDDCDGPHPVIEADRCHPPHGRKGLEDVATSGLRRAERSAARDMAQRLKEDLEAGRRAFLRSQGQEVQEPPYPPPE